MRNKIYIHCILSIILITLLTSCDSSGDGEKKSKENLAYDYYKDGKIKTETEVKDGKAHGLMKHYSPQGTLKSVYTYNTGKKDGPAVIYYPNGVLREKRYYKEGYRNGISEMYYRSGELYRESPFTMGKLEGIRKSYYKDGTLMASAPFKGGLPGLGLKEYNSSGELLNNKPRIIINPVNRLAFENKYILELRLSPPQGGTIFYIGDLKDEKYIHRGLFPIEPENGKGTFTMKLEKGEFRMETLTISAQYKTNKSNYGVVSRKYNLAIDNK